jgi:hypothetical protein
MGFENRKSKHRLKESADFSFLAEPHKTRIGQ